MVSGPDDHLLAPRAWREGLARLDRHSAPCPGFRSDEWARVYRTARLFMEQCADEAERRGWTAIELFGVHPVMGAARVDFCGALMVPTTSTVTSVSTDAIIFGGLTFRKAFLPAAAVLVWDFVWRSEV